MIDNRTPMSSLSYEPGLSSHHPSQSHTGSEPQLGGSHRLDLIVLDYLSRGLWTSLEELRRVTRRIPADQKAQYRDALVARLALVEPHKPLPGVSPWRGGRDQRVRIIDSLSILGDETTVPVLERLVNDSNAELRQTVIAALGRLRSEKALPVLCAVLRQPERGMYDRVAAADALALIAHPASIDELVRAFQIETSAVVLRKIVHALGCTGDERTLPWLIDGLRETESDVVRAEAAQAIGRLRALRGALYLLEALDDRSVDVRLACVIALQNYNNELAKAGFMYAASDADPRVRDAAKRALKRLSDMRSTDEAARHVSRNRKDTA